jgi:hypothetical protein
MSSFSSLELSLSARCFNSCFRQTIYSSQDRDRKDMTTMTPKIEERDIVLSSFFSLLKPSFSPSFSLPLLDSCSQRRVSFVIFLRTASWHRGSSSRFLSFFHCFDKGEGDI